MSIKQPKSFKDPRDGKVYKTIQIGGHIWMAENLAFSTPNCGRNYKINSSEFNGFYYETCEAIKLACPKDWRLPTIHDWQLLISNITYNTVDILDSYNRGASAFGGHSEYFDRVYEWGDLGINFDEDTYYFVDSNNIKDKINDLKYIEFRNDGVYYDHGDKNICVRCII